MSEYRGRRTLVLGGFGFIGSHLTHRLIDGGSTVTVVTRGRDRHREAARDVEQRGASVIEGDIRDDGAMRAALAGQQVVFDLAGRSGAVRSMDDPFTDLDVNCRGTLTLLEAVRAVSPAARVVFSGSRLSYGATGSDVAAEDHRMAPRCMHAVHKLAAERYVQLYGQVYGVRFAVARITNPYGSGQPRDRVAYGVVNRLIHLALSGERLPIYGDGLQRRDYIHVDDVVLALMRLGESSAPDGVYNVGSGVGTPIVEMARAIVAIAGSGSVAHVDWPSLEQQIETGDFVADVSKIRCDTGWHPSVTLDEGLRRTIAFYRSHVAS